MSSEITKCSADSDKLKESPCLFLNNNLDELVLLNQWLETDISQLFEKSDKILFKIDLVLTELLSNIVNYGYLDKTKSEIFIRCCVFQDAIQFEIEDYGIEFNPLSAPEHIFPQTLEQAKAGGLGLHLVRNYVDKCSYVREQKKNIFTIVFFR